MGKLAQWRFNLGLFGAVLVVATLLERLWDPPDEDGLAWLASLFGQVFTYGLYTLPTAVIYLLLVAAVARRAPPPSARLVAAALSPLSLSILVFAEDASVAKRLVAFVLPCLVFGALVRLPRRKVKA
jgi:hypothetical protein